MKSNNLLKITIICAIYVVLCLVFAPISFGPIQLRIAELLCLLAINYSWAIISLSLGCFISNILLGGLGIFDIIFGTIATLLACIVAYLLRNKKIKDYPILSMFSLVSINAIIVGLELSIASNNINLIPLYILEIFISEFIIIFIIGMPLYKKIIEIINKY